MSIADILLGTMMVIAIVNGKGGAGKTPTAVQLSYALAKKGYKVLFLDMDPQGSASFHFLGFKYKRWSPTLYHALKTLTRIEPVVILENLHLLPANDEVSFLEEELTREKGKFWQGQLLDLLQLYPGYQFVIADTPGSSISIFPTMALTTAQIALVPVKTEIAAVVGTEDTLNLIEDVIGTPEQRRPLNRDLVLWGILPTQYEVNTGSHNDALDLIKKLYGTKTTIYTQPARKTTLYNEASEQHIDIRETDRKAGPVLGAYWDDIAESLITQCSQLQLERKNA